MSKRGITIFSVSTIVTVVLVAYLAGAQKEMFDKTVGLLASLSPTKAEADNQATKAPHAQTVTPEARAKAGRIKAGMSRSKVENILGVPAMVQTELAGDGSKIQTAAWIEGGAMLVVRFHNGRAKSVLLKPMRRITSPEPQTSKPAGAGESKPPANLADALRDLAGKMKGREEDLDKMFKQAKGDK